MTWSSKSLDRVGQVVGSIWSQGSAIFLATWMDFIQVWPIIRKIDHDGHRMTNIVISLILIKTHQRIIRWHSMRHLGLYESDNK